MQRRKPQPSSWNLLGFLTHIYSFSFFSFLFLCSNCIRGVNANFCSSIDTCVQYLVALCALVFILRGWVFFSFLPFLFIQTDSIYRILMSVINICSVRCVQAHGEKKNKYNKPVISSMVTEKRFFFSFFIPKAAQNTSQVSNLVFLFLCWVFNGMWFEIGNDVNYIMHIGGTDTDRARRWKI